VAAERVGVFQVLLLFMKEERKEKRTRNDNQFWAGFRGLLCTSETQAKFPGKTNQTSARIGGWLVWTFRRLNEKLLCRSERCWGQAVLKMIHFEIWLEVVVSSTPLRLFPMLRPVLVLQLTDTSNHVVGERIWHQLGRRQKRKQRLKLRSVELDWTRCKYRGGAERMILLQLTV
jgi:hypothetical protein